MRKVIFIVAILLLAGCSGNLNSDGTHRPVGTWRRVKFEGHTYIQFLGYRRGGITHDPDCLCKRRGSDENKIRFANK